MIKILIHLVVNSMNRTKCSQSRATIIDQDWTELFIRTFRSTRLSLHSACCLIALTSKNKRGMKRRIFHSERLPCWICSSTKHNRIRISSLLDPFFHLGKVRTRGAEVIADTQLADFHLKNLSMKDERKNDNSLCELPSRLDEFLLFLHVATARENMRN